MSGVAEQFKVALHRVPAVAPSTVERPRPPAVSIEQRVCDLRALYAFALYLAFSIIFLAAHCSSCRGEMK
jgi:hypothetical protein